MPPSYNGAGTVELVCTVGGLQVTISGPSTSAANLLQQILDLGSAAPRASSPSATKSSLSSRGDPEHQKGLESWHSFSKSHSSVGSSKVLRSGPGRWKSNPDPLPVRCWDLLESCG
jgi:hypothetical protein